MARVTNAELLARISELEQQNSELRARSATVPTPREVNAPRRSRSAAWTALAIVLIVIGAILAPVSVVAAWAKSTLTDTERFVAAYAPLADDPQVQAFVTSETVAAIDENVDVAGLTANVIDGITSLGTGPVATRALEALKGPAAQGIHSLIETRVAQFVASDAFANVWAQALRVSHSQLVSAMGGDPDSAVVIGGDGSVGIQLGPIIDQAKTVLVDQGITFAEQIPSIDRTVVVAQSDALPSIQLAYALAVGTGTWLPWIALLLLAAGVLVARRRAVALIWAAVGLALAMVVTLVGFAVANVVFVTSVSPSTLPSGVAASLLESVIGPMRDTATSVLALALAVAVVGWLGGPFRTPRALRGFSAAGARRLRDAGERRGVTTGGFGEWVYTQRVLVRVAVAVIAAAVVLFVRPITPSLVVWTVVVSALVLAIHEIVQRPVIVVPADAEAGDPIVIESA